MGLGQQGLRTTREGVGGRALSRTPVWREDEGGPGEALGPEG